MGISGVIKEIWLTDSLDISLNQTSFKSLDISQLINHFTSTVSVCFLERKYTALVHCFSTLNSNFRNTLHTLPEIDELVDLKISCQLTMILV